MSNKLMMAALALLLLVACNEPAKETSLASLGASEQNVEIVNKVYEHFNNHNWSAMASLYSNPAEFKDPAFGLEAVQQTREEIAAKYQEMGEMFPDIKDEVVKVYPSGANHVVVEFVSSGSAPDGTKWSLPICTIFTVENGLITKDYTYYNNTPEE
ncbi:nuclear transport factor 2 family protein [Cesiribacter sp. SM1]|uniref:nuclear transport factor 2 family protein n=1 Tax=Cesiribacter sp. SM1 TaxID=2861196 RepID=UPI001CD4A27C|nr:nuclear transport factor 2 family protein [Cesiribacter sp. SM1]